MAGVLAFLVAWPTLAQGAGAAQRLSAAWSPFTDLLVPPLRDTDGKPPLLCPVTAPRRKMAVWFWPGLRAAAVVKATAGIAWDVVGPREAVALLARRTRAEDGTVQTTVPPSVAPFLCDWTGPRKRLADPIRGQPVAIAWVPSRRSVVFGVCQDGQEHGTVAGGPEGRAGLAPCNLFEARTGQPLRNIGSSPGLEQLADAGDARHLFAIETLQLTHKGKQATHTLMTVGLTLLDVVTGARRVLVDQVSHEYWLAARGGYAFVVTPERCPTWNEARQEWDSKPPARSGVLRVAMDGSRRLIFEVKPPQAVWGLDVSDSGLTVLLGQRQGTEGSAAIVTQDWQGNRYRWAEFPPHWRVLGPDQPPAWLCSPGRGVKDGLLLTRDREETKAPAVYLLRREWPRVMLLYKPGLAKPRHSISLTADVRGVGQVRVEPVGRLPASELRPWMVVKPRPDENLFPPGQSQVSYVTGAQLVYPMRVGALTFLFVAGRVYPLPVGPPRMPGDEDKEVFMVYRPLEKLRLARRAG